MDYYVCLNKIIPLSAKSSTFDTCEVDLTAHFYMDKSDSDIEKKWRNGQIPFVRFYISDLASLEDAQRIIKRKWPAIKDTLADQWAGKKRVIRPNNPETKKLHELIYFLSLNTPSVKNEYKEVTLQKILRSKYNITITDSNIKQIIARQRKLKKL
jgi:hypothetical protein